MVEYKVAKGRKPSYGRSQRNIETVIDSKLDHLIETTDELVRAVQKHAETLAAQNVTLAEHVRRTELLETEVSRLSSFRNQVTAIAAFTLALSTLAVTILKIFF